MDFPEQQSSLPETPAGSSSSPPSPTRQKKHKPPRWSKLVANGMFVGFAVVTVVFVYAFVHRTFIEPPVEPEIVVSGKTHTIQLNVLNGTGAPKLAQRTTDYMRARGFDVVEMGNAAPKTVEQTRVIDRSGNLQAAKQVAKALGVPEERVAQELDPTLYLDVSVIIGKDYQTLKPFH